jgi:pimeloyl-ACP methyl ester carboxylesterase
MDSINPTERGYDISTKVAKLFQRRIQLAQDHYRERITRAITDNKAALTTTPKTPWEFWSQSCEYVVDAAQRSVLFWDTLRQRGNNYREHTREGQPPLLHFDYEFVLDGRKLERPVNYALVRIVPPKGVTVDAKRRPYVIIDPRAGHGPGIGGFKDDSQVGVALREGHPVYFVIFFREPEPGQTLLDVCAAEQQFVRRVRALHPQSPKPAIVGNCQGGWAAMMVAASSPEDTGPIVINGAPMSYWGGAWAEGEGDNPMRYAGGMLGGTWLASFTADMGAGIFDGAYLVENFESLNPANTLWDKFYNLYAKVDTEAPRFLEFERWWGGFFLMNREEIEWITRNLFVGNKLWKGDAAAQAGKGFDLRDIKSPIILFASMGDNITPPQQAFNWVADVYASTDEIKARGQVIVGLLHEDVGHLGIFVSGKVAKKEHAQIVSVLKSVEALPPGLYGMSIHERKHADGKVDYEVEFRERRLEEIAGRLNRFQRVDEKPFEAVAKVSEFNQAAYELFVRPVVQAMANDTSAELAREFHPLRVQRWAVSDLNPWLAWLPAAAEAVKAGRRPIAPDNSARNVERFSSEAISASLDYYREVRDAVSEAAFFQAYGNVFSLYLTAAGEPVAEQSASLDAHQLPVVKDALDAIHKGSFPEALTRTAALLTREGKPFPLERIALKRDLIDEYRDLLPDLAPEEWRHIRGEQDIIVRYAPELALSTLSELVVDPADRERLLTVVERILTDKRLSSVQPSAGQRAMLARLSEALHVPTSRRRAMARTRKADVKRRPAARHTSANGH